MIDDALWKRRFHAFALVRVTGLLIFFLGVAIAFSDLVRDGGWPLVGGIIAIMGVIDAVFAPKLLRKHWEQTDRQG